jgi:hypothetical protein
MAQTRRWVRIGVDSSQAYFTAITSRREPLCLRFQGPSWCWPTLGAAVRSPLPARRPWLGLTGCAVFRLERARTCPVPQARVGEPQPFSSCIATGGLGQPNRLEPELIRILAMRDLCLLAHFFLRSSENTKQI